MQKMFDLLSKTVILAFLLTSMIEYGSSAALKKIETSKSMKYLGEIDSEESEPHQRLSLYLSNEKATQNQSIIECDEMGARLLYILNRAQDEDVRRMLLISTEPGLLTAFWTSGRRQEETGEWTWLSIERPITYENWVPLHYDVSTDVECSAVAIFNESPTYGWFNFPCSDSFELRFICAVP